MDQADAAELQSETDGDIAESGQSHRGQQTQRGVPCAILGQSTRRDEHIAQRHQEGQGHGHESDF